MNARLDGLDAEIEAAPGLEQTKRYARERVSARQAFVEGLRDLVPPEDATDLHETAIAIMGRLADAEARLAEKVYELDSDVGLGAVWDLPEGLAARAADEEAVELCLAAQSDFDQTRVREEFGDVPWVPPEMKEVIIVTFGCVAAER
jgi:hypothetical protein